LLLAVAVFTETGLKTGHYNRAAFLPALAGHDLAPAEAGTESDW
jgi:hypothetical protein